jgi:hypothetical protein
VGPTVACGACPNDRTRTKGRLGKAATSDRRGPAAEGRRRRAEAPFTCRVSPLLSQAVPALGGALVHDGGDSRRLVALYLSSATSEEARAGASG